MCLNVLLTYISVLRECPLCLLRAEGAGSSVHMTVSLLIFSRVPVQLCDTLAGVGIICSFGKMPFLLEYSGHTKVNQTIQFFKAK